MSGEAAFVRKAFDRKRQHQCSDDIACCLLIKVDFADYKPVQFTEAGILQASDFVDIDLLSM